MSTLLDALMTVGNILDTPGSIVRNTLAGQNPLQGLFDPEQRTTGRGLLEQWGVLGENQEGFDMGDLAGFGVDVVADPLSIFGLGKAAMGLGRAAGRFADEAVKAPALGVFGGALGDFSKYGANPRQIAPSEASDLFKPWAESLTPEEAEAVKLFTTGPQDAISGTLRGTPDPNRFSGLLSTGRAPTISSEADVLQEVVPYADSAMLKGTGVLPDETMTYRLADRMGDLTQANADSLLGQIVNDPSYLSTSVNPFTSGFYGKISEPGSSQVKFDILVPPNTPVAYPNAGKLSGYPFEQELMLPRGLPMEVLDTQKIQVATVPGVGRQPPVKLELTQSGVPIPRDPINPTNKSMSQIFKHDELLDFIRSRQVFDKNGWLDDAVHMKFPVGTWGEPVPPEVLASGWEDILASAPKEDALNVLLKARPDLLDPISGATTRRLDDAERLEVLKQLLPSARKQLDGSDWQDLFDSQVSKVLEKKYKPIFLEDAINRAYGLTSGKLGNMLKSSVPQDNPIGGMLEALKRLGVPIAGLGGAMSPLLQEILSGEAA